MKDIVCDICGGARIIWLPIRKTMSLVFPPSDVVSMDEAARTYPCPECAETVAQDRIAVAQMHSEVSAHIHDTDFRAYYTRSAAHRLVDQMLQGDFIRFERGPTDGREMRFSLRATVGLVAKTPVATLEQRISAHQAALAHEIAEEAIKQIRIWHSHYTGDEGPIHKRQAVTSVRKAVDIVLKRRAAMIPA